MNESYKDAKTTLEGIGRLIGFFYKELDAKYEDLNGLEKHFQGTSLIEIFINYRNCLAGLFEVKEELESEIELRKSFLEKLNKEPK